MRWHHWALVGLGVWVLISPWALGFAAFNLPLWSSVLSGILVVAVALYGATPPRGGA